MRTILLILSLAIPLQADEAAVRQVLSLQQEAWNRGDLATFISYYERSDETAFVGERVLKGTSDILARYKRRYPDTAKMGSVRFSELDVRMLGDEHASVIGRFTLTRIQEAGGTVAGVFTLILKKTNVGWRIILDHTTQLH